MRITIDDGGYGWAVARRAIALAEVFEEVHAGRAAGQRNCVIYGSSDAAEPLVILWWTDARGITVRVEAQPEVADEDHD